jgi:hypothetical protein
MNASPSRVMPARAGAEDDGSADAQQNHRRRFRDGVHTQNERRKVIDRFECVVV